MNFRLRKFYVWLVSLGAVFVIYLLYSQISETPQIDVDTGAGLTDSVSESNVGELGSGIGRIGDVGVGTVRKARYMHLNENKEIDREFGFEKLLHEVGDEWHIEKPYMNIFQRNFKCYLTADEGTVRVETAAGTPSPKNGTLTGNVVIHILPENSSSVKESFIYLDDVVFISEKSQFSTTGPVKFVSEGAQMLGRGLELVYNGELDRLEFLRIIHLETLHLKTSSEAGLFSSGETEVDSPAKVSSEAQTEQPTEPVAVDSKKPKVSQETSKQVIERPEGEYYRCLFRKNVVIDCPEQLVFADEIFINNIFWSKGPSEKSGEADTASTDNAEARDVTVAERSEPNESPEEFVDIVVTCDNGILVTPMDFPGAPKNFTKLGTETSMTNSGGPKGLEEANGRTTLVAQKIDYCVSTGDTIAGGPSELTFYVSDIMGAATKETAVPVKVTAQKEAKFLPALNQVIFEGDCLCTMLREDSNSQQKYTLSAPQLTVDLSKDEVSDADIEHLTASGGVVKLSTVKTAREGPHFAKGSQNGNPEKLLGGVEIKCAKFDYDIGQQLFLATGPGLIKVDNSDISKPKADLGRFSLRRRCYAVVRNFETLKYSLDVNRIIADNSRERILIDYFPIVQGQYGQQVTASAGHVEVNLIETADGQIELSTLSAEGGIDYEEENIQFEGSELFYDANKSIMTARGDEFQPCLLNGAIVEGVEYNLKTGKAKSKVTGPGILQMK